jgi:anti-sigma-K factor RskA
MSNTNDAIPERLIDLMVEQATQGLSPQDEAELQAELAQDESLRQEAEAYALAAAAAEVALLKPKQVEALPDALRVRLIETAPKSLSAAPPLKLSGSDVDKPAASQKFSFTDGRMFGWYAAAAALIALVAVLAFEPKAPTPSGTSPEPTLVEQYDSLADDAKTVTASWGFNADGGDPAYTNIQGEVIWNGDKQTGYMKLAGLPVNDPSELQYQLWIVDGSRSTDIENTNRIDGGVFDITAEGEVIVPIDAKLLARDAAAFAITVETPGGVVESKGPLQAVAVVEKS